MYLAPEKKVEIFAKNSPSKNAKDTGSAESQIALFTYRINYLNEHLKLHRQDNATKQGLLRLVGKRRKLLDYLIKTDIERYRAIIKVLSIRK